MHESVKLYMLARENHKNAAQIEFDTSAIAEIAETFPKDVRPATIEDLKEDQIFYYHDGDNGEFFEVVEEIYPEGWYEGSVTGCIYSIKDAFVEVEA